MTKQQRLVLLITILASIVVFLDASIVNVALPAIAKSLGGGLSTQQWVVDSYLLTLGSFILIAGSLSDIFGSKKILSLGLISFAITSILCGLSPNASSIVFFRALQGIAGALVVPSSLAIIINNFTGEAQGKAIGTWTAWISIAFIIGPLLGGFLVDYFSWQWVFYINVLPVILIIYLMKNVTLVHRRVDIKVDIIGALLCVFGLAGPVFALIEVPKYGWSNPLIYSSLIGGVAVLSYFIYFESKTSYPMLNLKIFRNHNFSVGNLATLFVYAGLGATVFLIVVFLQQVLGYSALKAGVALLPITIIMFFLSPKNGALSAKYGPKLFMGFGPILSGVGLILMTRINVTSNYWLDILPSVLIFGLGLSITVAPLTATVLAGVKKNESGIASAINNAISRIAGLISVALVGAVVAAQFSHTINNDSNLKSINHKYINQVKMAPLNTVPPKSYSSDYNFKNSLEKASVSAFHYGISSIVVLLILGGAISLVGIQNPKNSKSLA